MICGPMMGLPRLTGLVVLLGLPYGRKCHSIPECSLKIRRFLRQASARQKRRGAEQGRGGELGGA